MQLQVNRWWRRRRSTERSKVRYVCKREARRRRDTDRLQAGSHKDRTGSRRQESREGRESGWDDDDGAVVWVWGGFSLHEGVSPITSARGKTGTMVSRGAGKNNKNKMK